MQVWKAVAVAALSMAATMPARAATFAFTETGAPNDTIAQAQALPFSLGIGADQTAILNVAGSLVGEALGVVDWYSFYIPPTTEGVVFRGIAVGVAAQDENGFTGAFLPYRFTDAAGTVLDERSFLTQDGGTYYLGIENVAGVTGYLAVIGVTAVPEPATWALMLAGFAMTGYALRRRRAKVAFA